MLSVFTCSRSPAASLSPALDRVLVIFSILFFADGKIIWKTVLKDFKLMPSPHHETGSQDYFIIDAKNKV